MQGINDIMFVFYYKQNGRPQVDGLKEHEWLVSQPITMGEVIDGGVELELSNGDSLPMNDIDWNNDDLKMAIVPNRGAK